MKKGLLVVVLIFGLGILALAAFVVVRGMGGGGNGELSLNDGKTGGAGGEKSVSYADLFTDEGDGNDAAAEGDGDGADADEGDSTEMADDTASSDPQEDFFTSGEAEDTPTPRTQRKRRMRVASSGTSGGGFTGSRNPKPVGHKTFTDTSSDTVVTGSGGSDFGGSDFGGDDLGGDDLGGTTAAVSDGGDNFDFDDSSAVGGDTSGSPDDSFGFDDPGMAGGDAGGDAGGASAGGDAGGGDPFADFFGGEEGGDSAGGASAGGAEDPFAGTGGGGASASFKVASAGPAVKRVSHTREGGITRIRIELANASTLPQYRVFPLRKSSSRPARVAIDFEGTAVGSGPAVNGDGALITKIKLIKKKGASANIARVQIELAGSKPPPVDWSEESGTLVITLGGNNRLGGGREFPRRD